MSQKVKTNRNSNVFITLTAIKFKKTIGIHGWGAINFWNNHNLVTCQLEKKSQNKTKQKTKQTNKQTKSKQKERNKDTNKK